ncbi:hypothetical protein SOVF_144340 [Spinacia oleracea]|nr:hypothetical protein SOVF_144340 [Spinacia oleracea]
MCSGSKSNVLIVEEVMESEDYKKDSVGDHQNSLRLLELSTTNDLSSFKDAAEKEDYELDEVRILSSTIHSSTLGY